MAVPAVPTAISWAENESGEAGGGGEVICCACSALDVVGALLAWRVREPLMRAHAARLCAAGGSVFAACSFQSAYVDSVIAHHHHALYKAQQLQPPHDEGPSVGLGSANDGLPPTNPRARPLRAYSKK